MNNNSDIEDNNEKSEQGGSSLRSKILWVLRFLARVFIILVLCLLLLTLIIQTPEFQNWASRKTSEYLSEKYDIQVDINGFKLRFFDKLELDDVIVVSNDNDTLLNSQKITADFRAPIFTLFNNTLKLENIILENTTLTMKRAAGDSLYNLEKIINRIQAGTQADRSKSDGGGIEFNLIVNNIFLRNIEFNQIDSMYGKSLKIALGRGMIGIDKINLKKAIFRFDEIKLIEPLVKVKKYTPAAINYEDAPAAEIPALFNIKTLEVAEGHFIFNNYLLEESDIPQQSMDYQHLNIHDININTQRIQFHNWETTVGNLRNLSAVTQDGFTINSLNSDSIKVNPTITYIENADLRTTSSHVNADIKFKYSSFPAWQDFVNEVKMHVNSRNSKVYIRDIMNFAPELYEVQLFQDNIDQFVNIDGEIDGTVNDMYATSIRASLDSMFIVGDIRLKHTTNSEKLWLNINLTDSRFTAQQVENHLSRVKLSPAFNRLGATKITGKFKGTLEDFIVKASAYTQLGIAHSNLTLHLTSSLENARYDGEIQLDDFQLGKFIGEDSVGTITLDMQVREGKGLTVESVDAYLVGIIDSVELKDYIYKDIKINGRASNSRFNGTIDIKDENINANLDGLVFYENYKQPSFNIDLTVNLIDLYDLNFTRYPFIMDFKFSGSVDSFDIYNLQANSLLEGLNIQYKDSINLALDSLQIIASNEERNKVLKINSDIVQANINGDYSLIKSWGALRNYFIQSFPQLSERWELKKDSTVVNNNLKFDIHVMNSKGFLNLVNEKFDTIQNLEIAGFINTNDKKAKLNVYLPYLGYGNDRFQDVYLAVFSEKGLGNLVFGIDSTILNNQFSISPISIAGDLTYDTLSFNLNIADYSRKKDKFNLDGKVYPTKERFALEVVDDYIQFFSQEWTVNNDNHVEFGDEYLDIDSLFFREDERLIAFNSTEPNQLSFSLANIPLSVVNSHIVDDSVNLYGNLTINASLNDIYNLSQVNGTINIDSFRVNDDYYGQLAIEVKDDGTGRKSRIKIHSIYKDQKFYANGFIRPNNLENFYALTASAHGVPFTILEYLLYENISHTSGKVDFNVEITGAIDAPEVSGSGRVYEAQTRFDFLGVTYYIKEAEVKISPTYIDFSGNKVYDKYGNVAFIDGGLTHKNFRNFGADIKITSDRFLLLNTTEEINSFYYGHCMGSAVVTIDGLFTRPNINITAENTDNTQFYMSLFETEVVQEVGFVRFVGKKDTVDLNETRKITAPQGINLHLDLTANELGKVKIFMDKEAGNYIAGEGSGNIVLDLKRSGDVSMYGTYTISSGTYKYSFNLIKKTFNVREGGYIRWTGNPLDAHINIVAEYLTYASPYALIAGYQVSKEEVSTTPVVVTIHLQGFILHPNIDFGINLPEAQGNIKMYVENALTSLRNDKSKMEIQALSLLTVGAFWPGQLTGSNLFFTGGANIFTGFLSSQISGFLTYYINQKLQGAGIIDHIDVDVDYRIENDGSIVGITPDKINTNQVKANLKGFLFNERVIIDVGGNYVESDVTSVGSYLTGNFSIQYVLTEDRRLRIRFYTKSDQIIEGFRVKTGIGLRYQREFNSFNFFTDELKSTISKAKQSIFSKNKENKEKEVKENNSKAIKEED